VSFALLAGERSATFPPLAGWSAADVARRALGEHRAWLGASVRGERHVLAEWMSAQARTSRLELQVLAWLLSAARAALFHESLQDGAPRLAVTLAAAAAGLDERGGDDRVAREALEAYRAGRASGAAPPGGLVAALRRQVLALEGFAFTVPRSAGTLVPVSR
jgi:hypothetical protein